MSGGSRPVSPSAFRSSAVKAVPLFNSGELSTASPRALVSIAAVPDLAGAFVAAPVAGSLSVACCFSPSNGFARRAREGAPRDNQKALLKRVLSTARSAKAPARASSPSSPISGNVLAVAGSACSAAGASRCFSQAGGGVTTSASCTSSPVGWIAMIGARFSSTTTGASADLIGSATSTESRPG